MLEAGRVPIPGPSWVTPDSASTAKRRRQAPPCRTSVPPGGPGGHTEARGCPPSLTEAEATVYKHLGSAGTHSAAPSASGRRLAFCSSLPRARQPL